MLRQRTLKTAVTATGVGLHTGAKVEIELCPAPVDTGIVFRRCDLQGSPSVRADAMHVTDTRLCSALEDNGVKVATVEHLMSALAGLGVDNAYVNVRGPEIPILDGSAGPFVFLIHSAGIEEQREAKRFVRILRPVEVADGDKWARFEPYEGFRIAFSIAFDHPAIDRTGQSVVFDFGQTSYRKDIARARTFGFAQEVELMRAHGLALGGTLDNAVVVDDHKVLNPDGLRYADEFAKHKVLDAIGDLYMIGHPILGAFTAHKSGHELNNRLLRATLADASAYELVQFGERDEVPNALTRQFAFGAA
jgi:UDP-3-O-[3-hydroxymyristoyl] N-acetylglucosamine deacetylase